MFTPRSAFADPVPPGVPDAGARPAVTGPLQLPGASGTGSTAAGTPPVAAEPGPRGQEIMTTSVALETAGQLLRKLDTDLAEAQRDADTKQATWMKAADELSGLRERVGREAGEAYRAAAALGPLGSLAPDLHQLSVLAPGIGQQPGGQATARELERAEANERTALMSRQAATGRAADLTRERDTAKADYTRHSTKLTSLRTENRVAYERELAAIDAQQASLGAGMNIGGAVKGMEANPKAKRALQYAMSKRGSAYVWAAEGPDTFDCSGLVLWAYTRPDVGASLPRVANDQYYATKGKSVGVDSLLPGDLLFFATNKSDWRSVHHIGMYVGNGYMVHAPTTGDVVKVSPVWWSEFYQATRVFDAVRAAAPPPATPPAPVVPAPSTSPTPTPSPSKSPSPSPTPTPSPSKSTSPTPTPSPSKSTSPAPTPSPSKSASPSPTPTTAASSRASARSSGSAAPSPSRS